MYHTLIKEYRDVLICRVINTFCYALAMLKVNIMFSDEITRISISAQILQSKSRWVNQKARLDSPPKEK